MSRKLLNVLAALLALGALVCMAGGCTGTCETDSKGETQCDEWSLPPQR